MSDPMGMEILVSSLLIAGVVYLVYRKMIKQRSKQRVQQPVEQPQRSQRQPPQEQQQPTEQTQQRQPQQTQQIQSQQYQQGEHQQPQGSPAAPQQERQPVQNRQGTPSTFRERKLEHLIYLGGMIFGLLFTIGSLSMAPGGAWIGLAILIFSGYRFQTRPL